MSAKDLYIQNITVSEHDSFQVKFPNVLTNYPLSAVRAEDQKFKDWDNFKFTLFINNFFLGEISQIVSY